MKNKKWISLAAAVILAVTALPATVFAAKDGESKEELTKVTLTKWRIQFSMHRNMWRLKKGISQRKGWI